MQTLLNATKIIVCGAVGAMSATLLARYLGVNLSLHFLWGCAGFIIATFLTNPKEFNSLFRKEFRKFTKNVREVLKDTTPPWMISLEANSITIEFDRLISIHNRWLTVNFLNCVLWLTIIVTSLKMWIPGVFTTKEPYVMIEYTVLIFITLLICWGARHSSTKMRVDGMGWRIHMNDREPIESYREWLHASIRKQKATIPKTGLGPFWVVWSVGKWLHQHYLFFLTSFLLALAHTCVFIKELNTYCARVGALIGYGVGAFFDFDLFIAGTAGGASGLVLYAGSLMLTRVLPSINTPWPQWNASHT